MVDRSNLIKTLSDIISYNNGHTTLSDWEIASHINTIEEALDCLQDSEMVSVFDEIKYQVMIPCNKFILLLTQNKDSKTISFSDVTFSEGHIADNDGIKTVFTDRELKEIEKSHNINLSFAIRQKIND